MALKNKKFILVCSNMKIPIDQDECIKVFEAISTGDVKILRQGWFKPSYFVGLVEDDEAMKKFYEDKKYQIRDGTITEYPAYPDLFPELREQVKLLSDSKSLKELP